MYTVAMQAELVSRTQSRILTTLLVDLTNLLEYVNPFVSVIGHSH